jgi:tripartite-type tricarboxylate transporter receptor subunit TctC
MMAGVDLYHVPYRGGPLALTDLLAGRLQVMFDTLPETIGHIKAGRLRALAVTATARQTVLPDTPPMGEFLPGYEASGWYGIVAPKGTPTQIIDTLNKEINDVLGDPKIRAKLADLGGAEFTGPPAEFSEFIAEETRKWARVIKFAGITAE